ncbi:hypothetical protein ACFQH6_03430 [Halobacteriaceae archaeon GCM10025711]
MMRSVLQVTAVVALVLVAGCLGSPATSSGETTEAGTTTGAGTTAATTEPATTGTAPTATPDAYFVFENADPDHPFDVTLYLTDGPASAYRVTWENGSTGVVNATGSTGFLRDVATLEPADGWLANETYTVAPASMVKVDVRNVSGDMQYVVFRRSVTNDTRRVETVGLNTGTLAGATLYSKFGGTETLSSSGGDYLDRVDPNRTTNYTVTVGLHPTTTVNTTSRSTVGT